jgi:hypothetical protein
MKRRQPGGRSSRIQRPSFLEKALGSDYGKELTGDDRLTKASEYIIRTYRPNLLLVHLIELDGVHHRDGPCTKPAIEVAQREDGMSVASSKRQRPPAS